MMIKRLISMFVIVCMVITIIPNDVLAETSYVTNDIGVPTLYSDENQLSSFTTASNNDFEYIISNNEVIITDYLGNSADVIVPDFIEGYPVTQIERKRIFGMNNTIVNIYLPAYLKESSSSYGDEYDWFEGGSSIAGIYIDEKNPNFSSVEGVLYNKSLSTLIRYPEGKVTDNFIVPVSVTTFTNFAFHGVANLKTLEISKNVVDIPLGSFFISNIQAINIDSQNTIYASADGVLFNKSMTELLRFPQGKKDIDYAIPDGVITVNRDALEGVYLNTFYIPASVSDLNIEYRFHCHSYSVSEENANYQAIDGVLFNKEGETLIQYPKGMVEQSEYIVPDKVKKIEDNAFSSTALSSIKLPRSLIKIGASAFFQTDLTTVVFTDTLTEMGSGAFWRTTRLKDAYFFGDLPVTVLGGQSKTLSENIVFAETPADFKIYYHISKEASWQVNVGYPTYPFVVVTLDYNYIDKPENLKLNLLVANGKIEEPLMTQERQGYIFRGWYKESTCNTAWNFDVENITNDIMLYARWDKILDNCIIQFDSKGGSKISAVSTLEGGYLTQPVTPIRAGYVFEGWYKENELRTPWKFDTDIVKENMILYAKWVPNNYNIILNATGGTILETGINVVYGQKYPTIPIPTKKGYRFEGWYTSLNGTGTKIDDSVPMLKSFSHTLYANWVPIQNTVQFDSQGGSYVPTKILTYGQAFGNLPIPTKPGYTFVHWVIPSTQGNVMVNSSTVFNENISGKNMYAIWKLGEYVVSFNASGGTVSPANKTVTYTNTYGILPMPTKPDYYFTGWWTGTNGEGIRIFPESKVNIVENTSLYAQWVGNTYTATFDTQGGTLSTASKNIIYGSIYGALPTPLKNGNIFEGWWTGVNGSGRKITSTSIYNVSGNQRLYAKWVSTNINVTAVSLSASNIQLKVGNSITLQATITPTNATNKNIIWSSSNTQIATVNNGFVNAVGVGTVIITGKSVDGEKIASCTINVVNNTYVPANFTLSPNDAWDLLNFLGLEKRFNKNSSLYKYMIGTFIGTLEEKEFLKITLLSAFYSATDKNDTAMDIEKEQLISKLQEQLYSSIYEPIFGICGDILKEAVEGLLPFIQYSNIIKGTREDIRELLSYVDIAKTVTRMISIKYDGAYLENYVALKLQGNEQWIFDMLMGAYPTTLKNADKLPVWGEYLYQLSKTINKATLKTLTVHCPVDLLIEDPYGKEVMLVTNSMEGVTLTDFGEFTVIYDSVNDSYSKSASLFDSAYTIKIIGTGKGYMSIESLDYTGDFPQIAIGNNIEVEKDTIIDVMDKNDSITLEQKGKDGETNSIVLNYEVALPTSIDIVKPNIDMCLGEEAIMQVVVRPIQDYRFINYKSENEKVAQVTTSGKIISISEGETNIVAEIPELSLSAICHVTVSKKVSPSVVEPRYILDTLIVGESEQLAVDVLPDNAFDKEVIWSSLDENIATVSDQGIVTAVSSGNTFITAVTKAGSGKAFFEVSIKENKYSLNLLSDGGGEVEAVYGELFGGETIHLSATAKQGYQFTGWESSDGGTFNNVSSASSIFTMPSNNTTITANFTAIPSDKYTLTVLSGSGSGEYREGQLITITANDKNGYTFTTWSSEDDIIFNDSRAKTTSFIMPKKAIIVKANYNQNGSSQSISGGEDGIIIAPETTEPDTGGKSTIGKADKSKGITLYVTDKNVQDAINKAQKEAKKNGINVNNAVVIIKKKINGDLLTSVSYNLPHSALNKLIKAKVQKVKLIYKNIDITFDLAALIKIRSSTFSEVTIKVEQVKTTDLSLAAKKAIGNRPAYKVSLNDKNGKFLTSLGKGSSLLIAISYKLQKGEIVKKLNGVSVSTSGKVQWLSNSNYNTDKNVFTFRTKNFSLIGIGYKTNIREY